MSRDMKAKRHDTCGIIDDPIRRDAGLSERALIYLLIWFHRMCCTWMTDDEP